MTSEKKKRKTDKRLHWGRGRNFMKWVGKGIKRVCYYTSSQRQANKKIDIDMNDDLNVNDIDTTKCLGCKKGISLFTEDDGQYWHVDLFATSEAGESYKCENSDIIGKFLMKNGNRGTLLPNEQSKEFFDTQEMWWEDIITLAFDTIQDKKLVNAFLNEGEPGHRVWNLPNIEIERKLLAIAFDNGTDVNAEDYPDLIKWKTEVQ